MPRQRGDVRQPLAQATQDFLVGFGDLCVGIRQGPSSFRIYQPVCIFHRNSPPRDGIQRSAFQYRRSLSQGSSAQSLLI